VRHPHPVSTNLRALSLWRPWPWLILHAGKNVENRTWATRYRGPLILHAGNTVDPWAAANHVEHLDHPDVTAETVFARGFVGTVELVDVHPADACRARHGDQLCSPWAAPDGWHWQLANPRAFPAPIPGPGRQRLFSPPAEVIDAATP
jgi:hypothetical protein